MSCACEHSRMARELERIRRLAKGYARIENITVVIVKNADESYSFDRADLATDKQIVEYITPY